MKNSILKNQTVFAAIYILLVLFTCILALSESLGSLRYYTFQGNVFCLIVMIIDFLFKIFRKNVSKPLSITEFVSMITILTIGVIYCTVLADPLSKEFWTNYQSVVFHFVAPIAFTVYIFLYRREEMPPIIMAPWCLVPPLLYLGFIFTRNAILGIEWYPYPFINVGNIGYTGLIKNSVIIGTILLAVGFAILWIIHSKQKSVS